MGKKRNKMVIAVDFDGVIHQYPRKWTIDKNMYQPIRGALEAINKLRKKYEIIIFTARTNIKKVEKWLKNNNFPNLKITKIKPKAIIYIDDNAIRFISWNNTLKQIENIWKKHYKKNK